MSSNTSNSNGCKCCVYKDPVFITAQALSIVAICISWGHWATVLFGFAGLIMLQVAWCCKMPKGCLIAAGVFAVIAAVGSLAVAIYAFSLAGDSSYQSDYDAYQQIGILAVIGGLLWIGSAVCVFVFSCGRRLKKFEEGAELNKDQSETGKSDDDIPVVTIPVYTPTAAPIEPVAVSVNKVTIPTTPTQPAARAVVVCTPETPQMDDDEESWGTGSGDDKSVVNTTRSSKAKPDGTTVNTEVQEITHRNKLKSSVKTVRLSKVVGDGTIKEKVTITKTDIEGQQTKTTESNVIPFSDV